MALPTSGNEINFGALPDNRSSASKANISLKQESEFFAIGAVGPTGTSRANLNSEPYAISEFGGANYPNSVFSEVVAKLSTTTVGEYVDGETGARIYWDVDDGTTDNYTAGLKLVSDNSIVISETLDFDGSGATKYVTLGTIPNIAEATDKYYPFVTTGTYTNAVSSSIDHFDQITGASINSVSTQYVNSSTGTNPITFGYSNTNGIVTSRAWTFTNATNGNGSAVSITESAGETPAVTFTGTGTFPIGLSLYGNPSNARNVDTDSINVNVQYVNAIDSITQSQGNVNVSAVDGNENATFTCYSEGYSGTLTIGYDDNDSTSDTDLLGSEPEPVTTYYQREYINKSLTISSAGTYYPKAYHDGSAVVGSSFIVAPALAYSTTNDTTIDVGTTQDMVASVSAGTNASVAITSSPNIGGGTTTATMTPGSSNGRYTISYAGTANYLPNNVNNQTDILTVRPKIDSLTPSPSTVYGLGSYTSGYTPTGVSTTNTTVTAATTGTISGTGYSWTKPSGATVGGGGTGDSTVTMNFSGASEIKTFYLTVSGHAIGSVDTTSTQASANVTYVAYTQQNITSVTPTSGNYRRGATPINVGWTSINVAAVDIHLVANNTSYTTTIQQANAYDSLTSANTSEGRSYSAAIVDVGRSNVGTYNVRVRDDADTLPSTTAVSTINVLDTAPTTPGAFQDTAGGYNTSLVMSWAASSYVYQYILEKSDGDSDGSYNTTLATQTGTSYNLTAGSTSTYGPFYYRVRAKNFAQDGLTTEYSNYNTARRFLIYPTLTTSKNQITPSSATITTAGSVSFSTPQPATDNVSKYVYSTNSHCSITNSTQGDGSSVISHTTAVLTSTSVGTKTINLTVSGLSGQNNISGGTATITVNYAPEVTLVSVTGATPTWYTSTSLTVNTGWQGFALTTMVDKLDIKLFNSSNNQVGSTQTIYGNSIGQGSAGGTANYNHTWGTISGVATGYYFKSIAYDDENQASYEATSATFDIDGVSSYTVYGQEIFWNAGIIGYDTLISAADTTADGSNTNITETLYAITGTLADGVVLYDDEDLEPAHKFDGNYKYFKAGSYCFKIKGDTLPRGEIDDIRSIVPNTLATPTAAADGETDIDLTIPSSNTEVARSIRVHSSVAIGGNSTATWTVTQSTSYSTTKSMAAIFGADLAHTTAYTFKVQGYNDEQTGPYSSTVTVSTDSPPPTVWSNVPTDFNINAYIDSADCAAGYESVSKTITLANGVGNTTVTLTQDNGSVLDYGVALSTSGDPGVCGTSNSGTGFGTSKSISFTSGTLYMRFRHKWRSTFVGADANISVTFTNNSVSNTALDITMINYPDTTTETIDSVTFDQSTYVEGEGARVTYTSTNLGGEFFTIDLYRGGVKQGSSLTTTAIGGDTYKDVTLPTGLSTYSSYAFHVFKTGDTSVNRTSSTFTINATAVTNDNPGNFVYDDAEGIQYIDLTFTVTNPNPDGATGTLSINDLGGSSPIGLSTNADGGRYAYSTGSFGSLSSYRISNSSIGSFTGTTVYVRVAIQYGEEVYDGTLSTTLTYNGRSSSDTMTYEIEACFDLTSPVLLSDGSTKQLHQISIGDVVKSWNIPTLPDTDIKSDYMNWTSNYITGSTETTSVVTNTHFSASFDNYWYINSGSNYEFKVSSAHGIFVKDNTDTYRFKYANELTTNDKLFDSNLDEVDIISIETVSGSLNAGWIDVEDADVNFYAGILAHNKCFVEGTLVSMADGTQLPIEDIKIGDLIQTYDTITTEIRNTKVMSVANPIHDDIVFINFSNGITNENTFDHPYYVKDRGWCSYSPQLTKERYNIETNLLEIGDICYYGNELEEVTVKYIREELGNRQTYTIDKLEYGNTFFANGIVVHNEGI